MTIDILCKVVDNYGDIGVVYRLARALEDAARQEAALDEPRAAAPDRSAFRLRLVVDDLESFRHLCPEVDPALSLQEVRGWTLAAWKASPETIAAFAAEPPTHVVEAFACGRPDWFEDLLFDPGRPGRRLVLNLEYLTAEDWADDFHLMDSLTRSGEVAKRFFMPGFTPRTGGLILDRDFMEARAAAASPEGLARLREGLLGAAMAAGGSLFLPAGAAGGPARDPEVAAPFLEACWAVVFSYERDYGRIVADMATGAEALASEGRSFLALAAAGKSQGCFLAAWEGAGRPFPVLALPFLPQETWDRFLVATNLSIVRGEDSLSRAALAGRPFLWQAYPQEGRHHLVKVRALLERLRPFFGPTSFEELEAAFLAFNDRDLDRPSTSGDDRLRCLLRAAAEAAPFPPAESFRAFSENLVANGNLALPLLGLFRDFV